MNGQGALVLQRLRELEVSPAIERLSSVPGLWVVGGAVRDVLIGREPEEVDLVVEGDAVALARSLGEPAVVHEPFRTATVMGVDIASARRESYPRPGALPVVETGVGIEQDLARRDFSVNAMAVRLSDGAFREWPGARSDLEAGVLRVLHERSFRDDPTRVLRMARYAARLGFTPAPDTPPLPDLWTAGGARLGAEMRRLAAEPQPEAFRWLERLGVDLLDDASRVAAAVARLDSPIVALAAAGISRDRLDALAFPAAEREAIVGAQAPWVREALEREDWAAVRRASPEAVAVAGPDAPARRWLSELSRLRLAITGDDLVAAGLSGPAVGEALDRAWAALYAGAGDREAQLAAALRS
jgi:tRNA nucleotidyltransferase (CCA-adding enzyme)